MIRLANFGTADLRKIGFDVLSHDIVVLKHAVPREMVSEAVAALHEWSLSTPQSKGHPIEAGGAAHLISYLPPRSESRYIAHDFLLEPSMQSPISTRVMPVFERLRQIYCGLIGEQLEFGNTYDGFSFLPQVIQYPRGGGFFQEHFHPIRPQLIGLVLSGSDYGKDFTVGGGRFRNAKGSWVTTEGNHDVGDVTLFRFDIGHDITPVDPDADLDWNRRDGRWSFVLPLKPAHGKTVPNEQSLTATMICPSCNGTKIATLTKMACTWCNGARSIEPAKAVDYAQNLRRIAMNWRISGHHSETDEAAMNEQSKLIRSIADQILMHR